MILAAASAPLVEIVFTVKRPVVLAIIAMQESLEFVAKPFRRQE